MAAILSRVRCVNDTQRWLRGPRRALQQRRRKCGSLTSRVGYSFSHHCRNISSEWSRCLNLNTHVWYWLYKNCSFLSGEYVQIHSASNSQQGVQKYIYVPTSGYFHLIHARADFLAIVMAEYWRIFYRHIRICFAFIQSKDNMYRRTRRKNVQYSINGIFWCFTELWSISVENGNCMIEQL